MDCIFNHLMSSHVWHIQDYMYFAVCGVGSFSAPLAEGQRTIVMALCLSCVHPSVRLCICP